MAGYLSIATLLLIGAILVCVDKVADVLAGLREEKARLSMELSRVERAIAALEQAMGIEPTVAPPVAPPAPRSPEPPPPRTPGPYATSSFYEAAAAYLETAGEPKTSREIADALLAGGYPTRAANFRATVRTMLRRPLSAEPYGIHASDDENHWFFRDTD